MLTNIACFVAGLLVMKLYPIVGNFVLTKVQAAYTVVKGYLNKPQDGAPK